MQKNILGGNAFFFIIRVYNFIYDDIFKVYVVQ